jgi:hypothetical protein
MSLISKKEHILKVYEDMLLRRKSGMKKVLITGY